MQYVIQINSQPVDLLPSTKPEFDRQVSDVGAMSDVVADRVIGLDLPDTGNNRRITQYVGLVDSNSGFDRNFFRVDITYDGLPLIEDGKGYILEVEGGMIRVEVSAGNGSFMNQIQGLMLTDLRFPELDHFYDLFQVTFNINNDYTKGFIYPIIDYGRTTLPDVYGKVVRMYPDDDQNIFPAMFEWYVLKAIFAAQGYTVEGDIMEDAFFQKCIIPFTNEVFANGARYAEENLIEVTGAAYASFYVVSGDITYPIDYNAVQTVPGTNTVIAVQDTFYFDMGGDIAMSEVINSGTGVFYNVTLVLIVNGIPVVTGPSTPVILFPGDVVELGIETSGTALPASPVNASTITYSLTGGFYRSVNSNTPIIYGGTVNMEAQLPQMTQIEYVTSVMYRFGLVMQTDQVRKACTFYSMQDVVNRRFGVYDWTDKMHQMEFFGYSRKQTRYDKYGLTNVMAYTQDDTVQPFVTIKGNQYGYGSATFTLSDNTLVDLEEQFELAFAGTNDVAPQGTLNKWIARIPHWVETDTAGVYEAQELEPRCCYLTYFQGLNVAIDAGAFGTNVEPNVALTNFSVPAYGTNLDFGSLIESRYMTFIDSVLENCVRIEAWFKLTAADIVSFDHRIPVYLRPMGGYFYVEQIQAFVGDDRLTKCFLVRV